MKRWWLSFVDPDKPAGTRFLGVCIVEVEGDECPIQKSWNLGCNPGGEVMRVPVLPNPIPAEYLNRLLNYDEATIANNYNVGIKPN